VESYLPGRIRAVTHRERKRQFKRVVSWITEFSRQTQVARGPWRTADVDRWVGGPADEYGKKWGASAEEERLLQATVERARALLGVPLPVVWQHEDLNESNISYSSHMVRVFDWEKARVGLPLADLFSFATHWAYRSEGLKDEGPRLGRFRELFIEREPGDEIARLVNQAVERYTKELRIDIRFVPLLLVVHCLSRSSPGYIRVLAGDSDRLFGRSAGSVESGADLPRP
jgi:hypothetical protein